MKLTASQRRALEVIREWWTVYRKEIRPREFARRMWPDSPRWQVHVKCGPNGSHRGGGMYLAGGGYLGKLARLGLISRGRDGYALSSAGDKALEAK